MNDFIDNYCERLVWGLWEEPLNLVSSLALFAAAFMAWRLTRQRFTRPSGWLLIGVVVLIGLGSLAYHVFAAFWAMLADSFSILLYQILFLWCYAARVMHWNWKECLVLVLLFLGTVYGFALLPYYWLDGSLQYAPALIFLSGLGLWHGWRSQVEPRILQWAAGLFLLALVFRSLDVPLCLDWPAGTHFLWHLCTGGVLYLTLRAYLLNTDRP